MDKLDDVERRFLRNVIIAAIVLITIGGRWAQVRPYPLTQKGIVDAPNKLHRAYLLVVTDKPFIGPTRRYYEFRVDMGKLSGERLTVFTQSIPEWKLPAVVDLDTIYNFVKWSKNSAYVTLSAGHEEIKVVVPF